MRQEKRERSVEKQSRKRNFYDYSLLVSVLFLIGFGLVMLYSASAYAAQNQYGGAGYFLKRQLVFAAAGFVVMMVVSKIDYRWVREWRKVIYFLALILVVLTLVIGVGSHGSIRWMKIRGIRFQPSELMKIAVISYFAGELSLHAQRMRKAKEAKRLFLFWGMIPAALIGSNNLSTGIIVAGIAALLLFEATPQYRIYLWIFAAAVAGYLFAEPIARALHVMTLLKQYQLDRVIAWKHPGDNTEKVFQTMQGLYAIGSGGIFGKGLGGSIQKLLIPEAQNDMIFAIICEELGVFGAISLILIYGFIIYRMFDIARNARDLFGSLLVSGVMFHIALQAILNIAVATNVIPNTGVTLPFISYGGTSLMLLMGEIGLCLSVSGHTTIDFGER